jgi:hypothetical protein
MPRPQKPRRRPLGFFDAQDKVLRLRSIYATEAFGADRARQGAQQDHRDLDEVATPEPDEELEDSDISDVERRAAIARMRMRRDGMA